MTTICPRCGGSGKLINDTCPNCGGSGEAPDNPLLSLILTFQDGVQLGLQMDHPIPQVEAMKALGHFAADVGVELDITLPRPTKGLVAEAIEHFLAGADSEWSSEDMAKAIILAVVPDDLAPVAFALGVLFDASQAQHDGLDLLLARVASLDKDFYPSKSGVPWEAMKKGNAARDMARALVERSRSAEGN